MSLIRNIIGTVGVRTLARETRALSRTAKRSLRRHPLRNIGAATAAGVVAGIAVMLIMKARD